MHKAWLSSLSPGVLSGPALLSSPYPSGFRPLFVAPSLWLTASLKVGARHLPGQKAHRGSFLLQETSRPSEPHKPGLPSLLSHFSKPQELKHVTATSWTRVSSSVKWAW